MSSKQAIIQIVKSHGLEDDCPGYAWTKVILNKTANTRTRICVQFLGELSVSASIMLLGMPETESIRITWRGRAHQLEALGAALHQLERFSSEP